MNLKFLVLILFLLPSSLIFSQNDDVNTILESNYSLEYPKDWDLDSTGLMGTEFIIFSKIMGLDDRFKENVNLLIQDLPSEQINLTDYTEISEKQINTLMTNGEIIISERVTGENDEYHKMVYTGDQGIFNLKFQQYYFIKNQKAYVLTYTAETNSFSAFHPVAEKILNSFKLN